MPSVTEETLKKMRGSPAAYDSQGLQQPMLDPIMLIASLLGPAALRGIMSASAAAPEVAPEAFSQADSLLARLRANQPKIAKGMEQKKMADALSQFVSSKVGVPPGGTFRRFPLPSMSQIDHAVPPMQVDVPSEAMGRMFPSQSGRATATGAPIEIPPYLNVGLREMADPGRSMGQYFGYRPTGSIEGWAHLLHRMRMASQN
jgi:hypothetical protein